MRQLAAAFAFHGYGVEFHGYRSENKSGNKLPHSKDLRARSCNMITLLVVNVGSTSLKFKVITFEKADLDAPLGVPSSGRLEGIGQKSSRYRITTPEGTREGETPLADYEAALKLILESLHKSPPAKGARSQAGALDAISAVCFKPVHARDVPTGITLMDEGVLRHMEEFNAVAPVHNPPVIAAVRSFRKLLPDTPMLGLFEPAFHTHIAPHIATLAIPWEWTQNMRIRKYGFHGASHRYIAERTPEFVGLPPSELKIVSCHLGGSSSLAAIRRGRSVDTTMVFSPQSGLPQGTRCGDIDPFIMIYLMKEKGWTLDRVTEALSKQSGLLGISGVSAEFREIEAAAKDGNERAKLAIKVFAHQVQCGIAEMTIALEGMNTLVFTGGIGERSASFRADVCKGLKHLGVEIDRKRNAAAIGVDASIEAAGSQVGVLVLPTDEELVIAREAAKHLLKRS